MRLLIPVVVFGLLCAAMFSIGFVEVDGGRDRLVYAVVVLSLAVLAFAASYRWQRTGLKRVARRANAPTSREVPTWARLLIGLGAISGIFIAQAVEGASGGFLAVPGAAILGMFFATYRFMPGVDDLGA